jgi:hypothetical protein
MFVSSSLKINSVAQYIVPGGFPQCRTTADINVVTCGVTEHRGHYCAGLPLPSRNDWRRGVKPKH